MRWRSARLLFWSAGSICLLLLAVGLWPGGLELTVALLGPGGREEQAILAVPLEPGERFTLRYFHSVENSPVWEEHSLDQDGRIYVEEERSFKVMAGMGYLPGQGRLTQQDGFTVVTGIHRPVDDFILRVGSPGVDHTLVWVGGAVNLSALCPGRAVRLGGRPVSLLRRLWAGLCPGPAEPRGTGRPDGGPDERPGS